MSVSEAAVDQVFQLAKVFFKENWKLFQESWKCYFLLFWSFLIYLWSVALLRCLRKGLNTAASTTSLQKQMRHLWSCHTLSPMQSAKRCKTHFWVRWHSGHLSTSGRSKAKANNKLKTSEDTDTIMKNQWNEHFCHILPCSAWRLCTNRASRHRFPFLIRYGSLWRIHRSIFRLGQSLKFGYFSAQHTWHTAASSIQFHPVPPCKPPSRTARS